MMPILGSNASKFAPVLKNVIKLKRLSRFGVIVSLVGGGVFGSYVTCGPQQVKESIYIFFIVKLWVIKFDRISQKCIFSK